MQKRVPGEVRLSGDPLFVRAAVGADTQVQRHNL